MGFQVDNYLKHGFSFSITSTRSLLLSNNFLWAIRLCVVNIKTTEDQYMQIAVSWCCVKVVDAIGMGNKWQVRESAFRASDVGNRAQD